MKVRVTLRATILVDVEVETSKEEAAMKVMEINDMEEEELGELLSKGIANGNIKTDEVEVEDTKLVK